MEIFAQKINTITLVFTKDHSDGLDEITPLLSSLKKLKKIVNEPGYKNKFNKVEKMVWEEVFDQLLEEEKVVEPINIHSNEAHKD